MPISEDKYSIILSRDTFSQVELYTKFLNEGGEGGRYLGQILQTIDQRAISPGTLLEALMNSKRPQIFAESHVEGDGTDWTQRELSILGDISIGMKVSIFDNGAHQNPVVHERPFTGYLVYTPGALLRNDRGNVPADWDAVTVENEYDRKKYFSLYERRLFPVFRYISELAVQRGRAAFLTIPGIGCGQFSGPYRGQMGYLFRAALVHLLETHGESFLGIKAVYYDPYNECLDEHQLINGIQFIVRPLTQNNEGNSQLCEPRFLGAGVTGNFDNCELYSLVAWDHVSWPGNDYYLGSRATDDGVKAAATDTMRVMTGVEGRYSHAQKRYLPPTSFGSWNEVVSSGNIKISAKTNLYIQ